MSKRFFIELPFCEKESAKECGAKWDKDEKKWYVDELDNELYELFKRVNLNVKYDQKDFVKENEGLWDK